MTKVEDNSAKSVQYNPQRLANLCRLYIGDRSVGAFANAVDLSRSFVAHLVCAQLPSRPTQRSLLKFTDEEKAKGQNNIRRQDILEAAGYSDLLKDMDTVSKSTDGCPEYKKLSIADAIARYYFSEMPLLPMHMFIDWLVGNQDESEINMNISIRTGFFEIVHPTRKIVFLGIPAYCDKEDGIEVMKDSVKIRLIEAMCESQGIRDNVCFCILTDKRELYQYFSNHLPEIHGKSIRVLLTEDYAQFCEDSVIET